jgi:hypothetical protein
MRDARLERPREAVRIDRVGRGEDGSNRGFGRLRLRPVAWLARAAGRKEEDADERETGEKVH